ncbi:RNA ligase family protein [Streptomyces sp. NPDC058280]|uniref:RNA ligase family protein n=1 Tax=Streptomyces sp. NPDC058280 TaxID=3346419 RepID=UPI0036E5DD59
MSEKFTPAFREWPKTPRLFRDIVITEKIDGTNAAIHISEDGQIVTQSRKRIISPENDNYGFARWTRENAADLAHILGPGLHFGEWWGQGIQRRYGLNGRRFSLFNTVRWWAVDEAGTSMDGRATQSDICDQIDAVPVLYKGHFSESAIWGTVDELREGGSVAAPGFMKPEGVCVFHVASGRVFKVTADHQDGNPQHLASGPLNDIRRDAGKWEAAA